MSWKYLLKPHYLKKKIFDGYLNIVDIADADYMHKKRDCKDLRDTLMLADPFENFLKMCLEIYERNSACFLTAPGLGWQAALRKAKVKSDLLTDIDISLTVEKGIRGGICQVIH